MRGIPYGGVVSSDAPLAVNQLNLVSGPIPSILVRYAHSESWLPVSLSTLSQWTTSSPGHIFVTDSILKTHNPNEVFTHLRTLINDDQYVAFGIVTAENIKRQLVSQSSALFFNCYYPFHFLLRRVLPKLKGFRNLARVLQIPIDMSKAEIMGRLIYTGFELIDVVETDQKTILVAKRSPSTNSSATKPLCSEGFLLRMQRIGRYARPIHVYKLRSMHPYAEYVQAYIHETQGLADGGKFHNDFRVTTGGKLLRKFWLDEIPMLYNLLKGELKLVGVRPITEQYFSLYPESAKAIRLNHKPGMLPPFYADLPKTFEEIVQSELTYLQAYEKAPLQTDLRYLRQILTNILIHKARSN